MNPPVHTADHPVEHRASAAAAHRPGSCRDPSGSRSPRPGHRSGMSRPTAAARARTARRPHADQPVVRETRLSVELPVSATSCLRGWSSRTGYRPARAGRRRGRRARGGPCHRLRVGDVLQQRDDTGVGPGLNSVSRGVDLGRPALERLVRELPTLSAVRPGHQHSAVLKLHRNQRF